MSALLRCFRQTLRDIFRQKETLTLLVGASVLYSFFYPTPYLNQVLRDLPVVVVDRDHTALSRQLTRWLDASEAARVSARSSDLSAAQDSVRAGVSVRRLQASELTTQAAVQQARPVTFVPWPLFNPLAGYASYVVPAVFILILQQTLLIGIGALRVAERRQESKNEPLWALLGGKLGAMILIYAVHAVLMFGVVFSIYGFPMRASWPDVFLFLVPYFAAVTLLGLAIAELFDRPETSTVALVATSLPAIFVSGFSFPAEVQADWVRAIAVVWPSTLGIRGFLQLAEMGARFDQTVRPWVALWVQVVVYWTLAWLILRYRTRSLAVSRF